MRRRSRSISELCTSANEPWELSIPIRLREAQGNSKEARLWYVRALAVRDQMLGAHHPKTTETHKRLIALLHIIGQHEKAARLEAEAALPEHDQ